MDKIRVNTGSLGRTQSNVTNIASGLEKELAAMQSSVARMNSMWSGEANQSFNQAFMDDINFLKSICSQIRKLAGYEGDARREYDSCEQKVAQLIAEIRV